MTTWRVGDVRITKIVEWEVTVEGRFFLPAATREAVVTIPWLVPHFADSEGRLRTSVHALLVETPTHRVVVDTCIGNDKDGRPFPAWNRMQGRFLADLEAAGWPRDSVDTVLCTHLHADHVGWNTMLVDGKWLPTFAKARYLMGRVEFEHWRNASREGPPRAAFQDSVAPVFEAGLVDLVETDHRLGAEITLVPSVGHTPGHVSVRIQSRGETALITGDFLHHPCQMAHAEWTSPADFDSAQAIRTRHDLLGHLAGTPTLVIGTHFAGATAGRIVRDGDAFRMEV